VGEETKYVDAPLTAIRTAKDFLYFAWFLHEAVLRAAITPANFSAEIVEGVTTIRWPAGQPTQEGLTRRTWNAVLAAMAISAQATDTALDEAFGPPRPLDKKSPLKAPAELSDRDAARAIMYMLRCAYAHDPLKPRWRCGKRYLGVFRINAIGFTLDTTALDGQPWNIAHVGDQLGYFGLLEYCQKLAQDAEGS